jgi:hypothetical protein
VRRRVFPVTRSDVCPFCHHRPVPAGSGWCESAACERDAHELAQRDVREVRGLLSVEPVRLLPVWKGPGGSRRAEDGA